MTHGHYDSILRHLVFVAPMACAIWPFRRPERLGEDSAAIEAPDEQPDEAVIDHADWGIRLGMLGRFERAAERFQQAAVADPEDASALYNLALALDQAGDHMGAVEEYRRAAEIEPGFADVHIGMAIALLETGDDQAAVESLHTAAEIDADDPDPPFNLGCVCMARGDLDSAINEFRKAVKADPKDAQTRFNLAIALNRAGITDDSERELRDFLALARGRYPEQREYAAKLLGNGE